MGEWWGEIDGDTAGCVTEIHSDTHCAFCSDGVGQMLTLKTFPASAGYGKLRSLPSSTATLCSCCMGRLIVDTEKSYGVFNTTAIVLSLLRGKGSVGV